ncbi:ABC transporter ATP-binding protein [Luteimicrobium subarcticum]|uniref:NitT/TauT family transport system ATP-binding protein n=1 Tax=Luteimicrobium subarcticum TaxID=620910 RepID=A0A2M8WV69_9MICO|nr:ABC transporter ATP-binding protein [Luteimicrobium subarcticum]PJI94825.1 NitT/TauT family transport system ATP-binding protein [Luteimicrobium subarcticum]
MTTTDATTEPAEAAPGAVPADGPAPAVRVSDVTKRFSSSGPAVLDGVSIDIRPGEFVCLLGASGCGKSTLLGIVAGLDRPTSGTVEVGGAPAKAGRASLMFQESALFPWLTARRNIELALKLNGVGRATRAERATELLDLVRLSSAGDKLVHELSGGMRQRVALARALAQDSPVLLMDEPFAALDAITRDLLHDELERIWRETGRTIVFITHNVREAVRLGQRVLLMSSRPGRIVREWPVVVTGERRIEAPEVAALAAEITTHLREEIRRHAH